MKVYLISANIYHTIEHLELFLVEESVFNETLRHIVAKLKIHLVFSTVYLRKLFAQSLSTHCVIDRGN